MGFWNILLSILSTIADVIEAVVNAIVETIGHTVDTIFDSVQSLLEWAAAAVNKLSPFLGSIFNFIFGFLDGLIQGLQDILHQVFNIIRDVVGIVVAILRADFARVLDELGNLIFDFLHLIVQASRIITAGPIVGGIVRYLDNTKLRNFVEDLLSRTYGSDPERLDMIRKNIGLKGAAWGLKLDGMHKIFMLDSQNTPLWELHENKVINLYQLANLASKQFQVFPNPRTVVKSVGENGKDRVLNANRETIAKYLNTRGTEVRLRAYAMQKTVIAEHMDVAYEKCKKLGVKLSWGNKRRFSWFQNYETHEITTQEELEFSQNIGTYLMDSGLRKGTPDEDGIIFTLGAFIITNGNGWTGGSKVTEGNAAEGCTTPSTRSDQCCQVIDRSVGRGVIYKDIWPSKFTRYTLAHEIGHYLGLCHFGHHGVQQIMFTIEPGVDLKIANFDTIPKIFYLNGEPQFTLEDGKNVWRFIVDQMPHLLE